MQLNVLAGTFDQMWAWTTDTNAHPTKNMNAMCQRCRAKVQAESAGRLPYPKWVVLYPTGGSDLPERPDSRSVARQL